MVDLELDVLPQLSSLRNLCRANGAAIFVPPQTDGAASVPLLYEDEAAVVEFSDVEAASAFVRSRAAGAVRGSSFSSGFGNGVIVPLFRPISDHQRRRAGERDHEPVAWLALRFDDADFVDGEALARRVAAAVAGDGGSVLECLFQSFALVCAAFVERSAAASAHLERGTFDRLQFQGRLSEALERAILRDRPLTLMLIHPDTFRDINSRFGREVGDAVLRDISGAVRKVVREGDLLARYGAAVHAVLLPDGDVAAAQRVSSALLAELGGRLYGPAQATLMFSIGVAVFDPAERRVEHSLDLIRRAEYALNAAKRAGANRAEFWSSEIDVGGGPYDRLFGMYTGDVARDYRNMALLWDTVTAFAADPRAGLNRIVERLYAAFPIERAAIFTRGEESLNLHYGVERDPASRKPRPIDWSDLPAADRQTLVKTAFRQTTWESSDGVVPLHGRAIPLMASSEAVGLLFISSRAPIDSVDAIFLQGLAAQCGILMDRNRLREQEESRTAQELSRLQDEVDQLRRGAERTTLEYRSPAMHRLLVTARSVAPTDANILILGESGTGKEMLARTVHELSPRRDKALVIVDCGAIAASLIDSELFGHERGAFTGALQRSPGRLVVADGGTVLLDEIGELPLEVQSKLLRFVQEKLVFPVGGTKPRRVDVRILAATHRDLAADVTAGRFRADLYYRLNVVRLSVPPLRERSEDIRHLAQLFLDRYTALYRRPVRRFTPHAIDALLAHSWPGNIRELQNRVMQAAILAERYDVTADDLALAAPSPALPAQARSGPQGGEVVDAGDCWGPTREALRKVVQAALPLARSGVDLELGEWLTDILLLEANHRAGSVARRAAALLGTPESSFRRRYAAALRDARRSGREPELWPLVRSSVRAFLDAPAPAPTDRLAAAADVLFELVWSAVAPDVQTASRLLGLSPPTIRRRLASQGHQEVSRSPHSSVAQIAPFG